MYCFPEGTKKCSWAVSKQKRQVPVKRLSHAARQVLKNAKPNMKLALKSLFFSNVLTWKVVREMLFRWKMFQNSLCHMVLFLHKGKFHIWIQTHSSGYREVVRLQVMFLFLICNFYTIYYTCNKESSLNGLSKSSVVFEPEGWNGLLSSDSPPSSLTSWYYFDHEQHKLLTWAMWSPVLPSKEGGRPAPGDDRESLWEVAEVDKVAEWTLSPRKKAENEWA